MKNVLSAGVVVYRMNNDEPEFLLIFNAKGHWDFGKGKIEEGEDKKTAALRELQEEAGITAILKNDFEYSYSYDFIDYDGKKAHKTISFFMGLANNFKIALSHEHTDFGWFCLKDALKKLEFQECKELLKKVVASI